MKIKGNREKILVEVSRLDSDKIYEVEIKDPSKNRTLKQNRYMWKLIRLIAEAQLEDEMKVYIDALESADAKYEYIMGLETAENELKKNFRAVKVIRPEIHNGKRFIVYKCFIGSSKMNTKEMKKLIEILEDWCAFLGIPTEPDLMDLYEEEVYARGCNRSTN